MTQPSYSSCWRIICPGAFGPSMTAWTVAVELTRSSARQSSSQTVTQAEPDAHLGFRRAGRPCQTSNPGCEAGRRSATELSSVEMRVCTHESLVQMMVWRPKTSRAIARTRLSTSPKGGR